MSQALTVNGIQYDESAIRRLEETVIQLERINRELQADNIARKRAEAQAKAARALLSQVFERVTDAFVALDNNWRFTYVNPRAGEVFGRKPEDLIGKQIWKEFPEGLGLPFTHAFERAMREQKPVKFEDYYPPYKRWFENIVYPSPDGLSVYFHDITDRRWAQALFNGQKDVLEKIARGATLSESLTALCRMIEAQAEGMAVSILLLDEDGIHVRHGAAPSLPDPFVAAINGQRIGPSAGSCGTAMHLAEPVIVEDVTTHPYWQDYREVAAAHGLRACWSTPIFSAERKVLGSFACYFHEPRKPGERELRLIDVATYTAAIAITRDHNEAQIRSNEARYRTTLDNMLEGCQIIGSDWRYVYINDIAARHNRRSSSELIGHTMMEMWPGIEATGVFQMLKRTMEERVALSSEVDFEFPDKSHGWFDVRSQPMPEGIFILSIDITERKKVEAALRESEERLRLALDAAHLGTFDWDVPCNKLTWSRWHEQMWNIKPGEFGGTFEAFSERVHPEDLPGIVAEIARCIAERQPYSREFRVVWPDGSVHWILGRGEFTFNLDGKPIRMHGVTAEITERKLAEQQLLASRSQLQVLSRQLIAAQETERRHIARELHDEIGQVLTAISINLHSVKSNCDPAAVAKVEDGIEMTDRAIQQVRNMSLDLRPTILDDFGLAAALRWYLDRQSQRSGIPIHLDLQLHAARLPTEVENSCFRVTQEAINNIARHARAKEVWASLHQDDGTITLIIRDDGAGFDVKRARERAASGGSTGLLSMHERVELLGGSFSIDSTPGRGTTIRAILNMHSPGRDA